MMSDTVIKRENSVTSGKRGGEDQESMQPVLTGQSEKRSTAVKHIQRTFDASKRFQVGV